MNIYSQLFKNETLKKNFFKAIRFAMPIIVLAIIFLHIDFKDFQKALKKTDQTLAIIGFMHAPLLILIASYRWKLLLNAFYKNQIIKFKFVLEKYWIGLSLGFFSPASLGMDAFRIFAFGKKIGNYSHGIAVIIVEKIIALINCGFLILFLYPYIPVSTNELLGDIIYITYIVLIVILSGASFIFYLARNKSIAKIINYFIKKFDMFMRKSLGRNVFSNSSIENLFTFKTIFNSLNWLSFSIVFLLSISIQVISSIKSHIFFMSLGYDIPFIINLFAAPTLYFIFMLPISLGSVGIREGVYILLYSLFGVPKEIALIVSLLNFGGMILNAVIGGFIMLFHKKTEIYLKSKN